MQLEPHPVVDRLIAMGVGPLDARHAAQLTPNLHEALHLVGRNPDGTVAADGDPNEWREYWSLDYYKYYYCCDAIGANQWDAPPCFRFREWSIDSTMYDMPITTARGIYEGLDALVRRHPSDSVQRSLETLSKILGNIADYNNAVDKFRSIKLTNQRFKTDIAVHPEAMELLTCVGFRVNPTAETVDLPANALIGPIQAAAARTSRLASKRGHSGSAKPGGGDADGGDTASGSRPPSRFYGAPGFRYQERIYHCNVCDHPINDGSERLWTRQHDAPHGEYRYECTTCSASEIRFNLCQACWDRFHDGYSMHDASHAFQHIGPRMTRHNDYYGTHSGGESSINGSNPWGSRGRNAGYARGLARLAERYGIQDWG